MNDTTDDGSNTPARRSRAPGINADEQILWSSTPGQVVNLPIYLIAAIAAGIPGVYAPWPWVCVALVPLAIAGGYAGSVQATRYELTSQRLHERWGLLTYRGEEVELYRVEDTNPTAPLLYRLAGRGNVEVLSTDRTAESLTLRAIKDHESVRNRIRDRVEAMRQAKGTRVVESAVMDLSNHGALCELAVRWLKRPHSQAGPRQQRRSIQRSPHHETT